MTFFTTADAGHLKTCVSSSAASHARRIVNVMRESGCEVPQYMLELKAPSKNDKRKLKQRPIAREAIGSTSRRPKAKRARSPAPAASEGSADEWSGIAA